MASPDPNTTKEFFFQALDLEQSERTEFLEELRERQPRTALRVDELLAAHEGANRIGINPSAKGLIADVEEQISPAEIGARIGDYELIEEIAAGTSGVVWRARQRSLDRVVAIKLLRAGRFAGQRELDRFREEAAAVARLDHPHIVPVYEIGQHEGHAYFSMKWIEGGSLAAQVENEWHPRRIARLMVKICRAVHHAHQRGLLHRDLKPSNVLLDIEEEPHVADFGIAKRIDVSDSATGTAHFAGTPAYMAPEQSSVDEDLTVETDVWALGCILYEMVCGEQAFQGRSMTDLILAVRERDPAPPSSIRRDLPRDLETIVMCCLQKRPSDRYASANALADDLLRFLEHEPILAKRSSPAKRLWLYWQRSPRVASLLAIVVLLVISIAVGASSMSLQLRDRLRDSWRDQAIATRLSGATGRRAAGIELITRAAAIRPGMDLRDEAIAILALTDFDLEQEWPMQDQGFSFTCDPKLETFAWIDREKNISLGAAGGEAAPRVLACSTPAKAVKFSEDGSRLVAMGYQGSDWDDEPRVWVWDAESLECLLELERGVTYSSMDISPDQRWLAIGASTNQVALYDLDTGDLVHEHEVDGDVSALRFRPDGRALIYGLRGEERTLELISIPGGDHIAQQVVGVHIFEIHWIQDGQAVLYGSGDYAAYVWRPGAEAPDVTFRGHVAEVVRVMANDQLPFVVTYAWDETLRLWDSRTGEEILSASARPIAFSADGRRLAFRTNDRIGIWRLEYGEFQHALHAHVDKNPISLDWSSDGKRLVSAGSDGAFLWDVSQGRQLARLSDKKLEHVLFRPDGQIYLSGAEGILLMDMNDPAAPEVIFGHATKELDQSADGERLVVRQGLDSLRIFEANKPLDGRVIQAGTRIEDVYMSPDGTWVAAATWKGVGAHVWDAETGDKLATLMPEETTVTVSVSPRGDLLATGTKKEYRLWSTEDWSELHRFEREVDLTEVGGPIAFHPDGTEVAVMHTRELIAIHDTRTGERLALLEAPEPVISKSLRYSPDGSRLAACTTLNRVRVWNLDRLEAELTRLGLSER